MRTVKGGMAGLGWVGELVLNSMNDVYVSLYNNDTGVCMFSNHFLRSYVCNFLGVLFPEVGKVILFLGIKYQEELQPAF